VQRHLLQLSYTSQTSLMHNRKKMKAVFLKRPIEIPFCEDIDGLTDAVELMLDLVQTNIDKGFILDIDAVFEYAQDGFTLVTFNLLVKNLNKTLSDQARAVTQTFTVH